MAKSARRARKKANRRAKLEENRKIGAIEFSDLPRPHLEQLAHTLDRLVALRNQILVDLRPHLTDEHKKLLCYPGPPQ